MGGARSTLVGWLAMRSGFTANLLDRGVRCAYVRTRAPCAGPRAAREAAVKRTLLGIGLLVASSGLLASGSHAPTWLAPARLLTEDEKLELALSESDAVGLGYVVAVHDTIVDVTGGTGIPYRWLELRAMEWLKGMPGSATLAVGIS